MGRRPRESGHLQGKFPLRNVAPNQRGLSSSQPQYPLPSQVPYLHGVHRQDWLPHLAIPPAQHWFEQTTDALSPVSNRSTLSPESAAASSYTAGLGHARNLSPEADTPTSSTVSIYRPVRHTDRVNGRSWQPPNFTSEYTTDPDHQMTEDVVGIDVRAPYVETQRYLRIPQFISQRGPSPSSYQRYPCSNEPWNPYPFRHEDLSSNTVTTPPSAMDMDVHPSSSSPISRERGGGRTGPLSQTARQQASDVRRMGACLRCTIMREKCDLNVPCQTCSTKDRRKFPKNCIRAHFNWDGCKSILFPDELTYRLQQDKLFQYLSNSSFTMSDRPNFKIPLDMNIGLPLYVMVKEFYPLDLAPEIRHAYRAIENANGVKSYGKHRTWSPPIIMFVKDGDLPRQVNLLRQQLKQLFEQVLDDPTRFENWTMEYYQEKEEDFQTTILGLIGKYYRKDIDEHAVLKTSLSLLWFEYLLLNKFTVPPHAIPQLEANLESRRPPGAHRDVTVVPETINRFLKATVLPLAVDAAKKLTETLHDMLFKMAVSQKLTTARTDLALCMAFILMMFLGRAQLALRLLADSPSNETGMEYTSDQADRRIQEMEEAIGEYLVSFHKYTLSRKPTASSSSSSSSKPTGAVEEQRNAESSSDFELHARKFDLVGRLRREIEEDYGKQLPQYSYHQLHASASVNQKFLNNSAADNQVVFPAADERPTRPEECDVSLLDLQTFRYMNVRRLCWKLFQNVERDR
ncbi:uncharacterized protein Z518_10405 [Rhinocladiella mackenziei CBS 650.93]|uniref:Zn(2)-C6 fungal-type domain-containing protein n=1 Tax=Rhinocladiella mackenziei CBS 650.93 TaxID=1442369 RepID=A0A0D2IAJ0_9EURO|nr:uncharacterized protein Z518_10405 [Rhinocladiella mackenziei CBS 650.93]KIX00266.1 hypothetical protein Z518_10405 [Rhinocladiella mackenziei CBS 650.93]